MKKLFFALASVMIATCLLAIPAHSANKKVVNVFNWSEYVPQDMLDKFTKETGIEVVYTTFESNEAMFAKLKLLGGSGYDVVVPSGYMLTLMKKNGLLKKLDKSKITGLSHLDKIVMGLPADPQNDYSIPYMWGVTGMMVNKKYIDPSKITSWNDLMRPEFKGKVILSDDLRDTMGIALKALGYSVNTTKKDEIEAAYKWLKALSPSVRVFDVTATKQAFISEEVYAGMSWNGDAYIAMSENPDLVFIYPKEGVLLWGDNFIIPSKAKNVENAYKFINFMLRPEVAARCTEEYNYTTPNIPARTLLPKEMQESSVMHPMEKDMGRAEWTDDIGDALPIYEKYWEMLKTDN